MRLLFLIAACSLPVESTQAALVIDAPTSSPSPAPLLWVGDSTRVDKAGGPITTYFGVDWEGRLIGEWTNSARRQYQFYGGDSTLNCDAWLKVGDAKGPNAPAGQFDLQASGCGGWRPYIDDNPDGTPKNMQGGIPGCANGGVDIMPGSAGTYNTGSVAIHAYSGVDPNDFYAPGWHLGMRAGQGQSFVAHHSNQSPAFNFYEEQDTASYSHPLLRVGYLGQLFDRLRVFANGTRALVVDGWADGALQGPVVVNVRPNAAGVTYGSVTINAVPVGGPVWNITAGKLGTQSFLSIKDMTSGKAVLQAFGSGNVRIGTPAPGKENTDPGVALATQAARLELTATLPACDSTTRGDMRRTEVAGDDVLAWCRYAGGVYAWVTVP